MRKKSSLYSSLASLLLLFISHSWALGGALGIGYVYYQFIPSHTDTRLALQNRTAGCIISKQLNEVVSGVKWKRKINDYFTKLAHILFNVISKITFRDCDVSWKIYKHCSSNNLFMHHLYYMALFKHLLRFQSHIATTSCDHSFREKLDKWIPTHNTLV